MALKLINYLDRRVLELPGRGRTCGATRPDLATKEDNRMATTKEYAELVNLYAEGVREFYSVPPTVVGERARARGDVVVRTIWPAGRRLWPHFPPS